MLAPSILLRHRSAVAVVLALLAASLVLALAGCGDEADAATTSDTVGQATTTSTAAQASQTTVTTGATTTLAPAASTAADGFFDASKVHEISVAFSEEDYDAMIQTYKDSGVKDWIEATVVIDGVTYQEVGMRLKGNSSIMGLRNGGNGGARGPGGNVSADDPQTLPWLIRLDKYVDGQDHDGSTDFVVRSNTSSTSLNEAISLELLDMAGLASLKAVAASFTVNGSDSVIRLVTELPNDEWMAGTFDSTGALYKAESSGDYSYRGDDPSSYDDVFDQEAGDDNTGLTPLIEFLDFINNSDDETFASELPERLDIDAFATYLAMEDLLGNFDDIDGPGNNSYLYYDTAAQMFTVVPWDHNLAFGATNRGGAGAPAIRTQQSDQTGVAADTTAQQPTIRDGRPPLPYGADAGQGNQGGIQPGQGMTARGKPNILVTRFHANAQFQSLYDQKLIELKAQLYESGAAQKVLDSWVGVLKTQASDLLDASTIDSEATSIAAYFSK